MKRSKAARALEQTAARYGVSVEEVREEINIAIDLAMANPDPEVQAHWAKMSRGGKKPEPEDVLNYLAKKLQKK